MIDWIGIINLIGVVIGLTVILMGLFFSITVPYLKPPVRSYLIILFILLTAYVFSDLTSQLSLGFGGPGLMLISKAAVFFESLFSSLCMPLLTMYILTLTGKRSITNPFAVSAVVIWLIYFFILCCTQFTTGIYYFTPDNVYHRGPLYPVLLTPPLVLMLINLLCLYKSRNDLTKRESSAFMIYFLIPAVCMAVQMIWYGLLTVVLGTAIASGFLLGFMIREQMELYIKKKEEIVSQRASILILQMRPHFIYNTLTSIYYLCEQDSKKAQRVTMDFAQYLRMNFNAISKNGTVPFSDELEHTKSYLAVETARFESSLSVEYDFEKPPEFRIPPLTLQPVVENSIKHGLDVERGPLSIVIRVYQDDKGNTITIDDNGQGIKETDNDEPHIALKNIRERLKLMCGGSLTISPRDEGGTRVTIFIP